MGSDSRASWMCVMGVGLVLLGVSGAASASTGGTLRAAEPAAAGSVHVTRSVAEEPGQRKVVLTISAVIDGRSILTITGNKAQWHHVSQAAPGRHLGESVPTKIGKASWLPTWPAEGENRDCKCNSKVFTGVDPPLPATGPITFTAVSCREICSATTGPGTAAITLDDNATFSSAPYVVTLTYYVKDVYRLTGNFVTKNKYPGRIRVGAYPAGGGRPLLQQRSNVAGDFSFDLDPEVTATWRVGATDAWCVVGYRPCYSGAVITFTAKRRSASVDFETTTLHKQKWPGQLKMMRGQFVPIR